MSLQWRQLPLLVRFYCLLYWWMQGIEGRQIKRLPRVYPVYRFLTPAQRSEHRPAGVNQNNDRSPPPLPVQVEVPSAPSFRSLSPSLSLSLLFSPSSSPFSSLLSLFSSFPSFPVNTRDCVKREKVCFVLFSSSSSLLACFSWFFSLFVRVLPLLDGSEGYTT